jgi:GNAT superfamily N-acetyltransferase
MPPAGLTLLPASPADQPGCARVFVETYRIAFPQEPPEAATESAYYAETEGEKQWIGHLDNKIIALISIDLSFNFIHHFYVLPTYQRQGIGTALLGHVMRFLDGAAELKTDLRNASGLAFYRRLGWREVGEGVAVTGPWLRFRQQGGIL